MSGSLGLVRKNRRARRPHEGRREHPMKDALAHGQEPLVTGGVANLGQRVERPVGSLPLAIGIEPLAAQADSPMALRSLRIDGAPSDSPASNRRALQATTGFSCAQRESIKDIGWSLIAKPYPLGDQTAKGRRPTARTGLRYHDSDHDGRKPTRGDVRLLRPTLLAHRRRACVRQTLATYR